MTPTLEKMIANTLRETLGDMLEQLLDKKLANFADRLAEEFGEELRQKQTENKVEGYDAKEVCRIFHINNVTLWRWQQARVLTPVKVNRRRVFLKSDVEKLIQQKN